MPENKYDRPSKKRSNYYSLFYLALLILLFAGGYFVYLAYAEKAPVTVPEEKDGGEEEPALPVGGDRYPADGDQETPPQLSDDPHETPGQPSRYPPPPGELLVLADGNNLLALVTKQTYLGQYTPPDLIDVPLEMSYYRNKEWRYQLRREALEHLIKLWEAARSDGLTLTINSAYRSYATQEQLFKGHVARLGGDEEAVNRFSARPGQSEHQLGTTVDFATPDAYASQAFADTPEGAWLEENSHKFGFVISYPEGSEQATGYIFEPWHFRYIGIEAALAWKESGEVLSVFLQRYPQEFLP